MIAKIYCIYDKKAKLYHAPQLGHNDEQAKRMFQSLFNKDNVFNEYPEDFSIWDIGTFNDENGFLVSNTKPELLIEGKQLIRKKKCG